MKKTSVQRSKAKILAKGLIMNLNTPPFVPTETTTPLKSEQPCLPTFGDATPGNPFILPPTRPQVVSVKSEAQEKASPNPFKPSSSDLPRFPVKMERQSLDSANPFTPHSVRLDPRKKRPSPSEVALQEIVKLQAKQTVPLLPSNNVLAPLQFKNRQPSVAIILTI